MKIIASSDFHGRMLEVKEPFDLFLIAGDICPVECHGMKYQEDWIHNEFVEWVNSLPFKTPWSKVVMTPGNHDFIFRNFSNEDCKNLERMCNNRLKVLIHLDYVFEFPVSDGIDSLKIFASPYCSIFGRWAFMKDDETLDKLFREIPEDTDILVCHDSPNVHGLGDITQGRWKQSGTGNKMLYSHIKRVMPKLFVCGHFHSGNHDLVEDDGILMSNVSYINEDYEPYWPLLELNYDEENRNFIKE